jgi:hypothetical protein
MASQMIQFDDSIQSVVQHQRTPMVEERSSLCEKRSMELDDEEKARRIANSDLHGSRKQVSPVPSQ